MSLTTRVSLVGTAALAIAGTAFGGGSDNDALAQIAELKQELAELKSQNNESWLTEQRAEEVRGIVQDVLADAETRTSLQDSGAMAGWNNGFFLSSADGNYKLNISGLVQARWMFNDAKKGDQSSLNPAVNDWNDRNTQWGFSSGYTLLNFSGNVVDPSWTYRVRINLTQNNPAVNSLLDFAYIKKTMDNGLNFTMGQFRAPWMREVLVEDGHQLAVTRSMLATIFGQGFSQGFQVGYAADDWNVNAMYADSIGGGFANVNNFGTTFAGMPSSQNTAWNATPAKWSFAARGEYKLKGTWKDFEDESSFRDDGEFGMLFGASIMAQNFWAYNSEAMNPGFPGQPVVGGGSAGGTQVGLTADVTAQFGGWSISGAGVWVNSKNSWTGDKTNPWGVNVQGGYFVTDEWELFGRYEYIDYNFGDAVANSNTGKYNGVTIGANWFMAKHNAKFTVDWSINMNSFGDNIVNGTLNSVGWRTDAVDANGEGMKHQWALRAQMQLMF